MWSNCTLKVDHSSPQMHSFSLNQALMIKDSFSKACFVGCLNLDCSFIEPQSPLGISVDSVAVIFLILLWIGALKFYYKTRQHVTKWYNQGLGNQTSSAFYSWKTCKIIPFNFRKTKQFTKTCRFVKSNKIKNGIILLPDLATLILLH